MGYLCEFNSYFPSYVGKKYGHKINVVSRSFYTASQRHIPFTDEIFLEAIRRTVSIKKPDPLEELMMDVDLFISMRLSAPALLQASSIIEIARDRKLQSSGNKLNDLKTSNTDLIKHVSVGFDRVYGRSLERDDPALFEFLKGLYVVRGHIAHATPLDSPTIADRVKPILKTLPTNVRAVLAWILGDEFPACTPF
jgi:hypothetical protein